MGLRNKGCIHFVCYLKCTVKTQIASILIINIYHDRSLANNPACLFLIDSLKDVC